MYAYVVCTPLVQSAFMPRVAALRSSQHTTLPTPARVRSPPPPRREPRPPRESGEQSQINISRPSPDHGSHGGAHRGILGDRHPHDDRECISAGDLGWEHIVYSAGRGTGGGGDRETPRMTLVAGPDTMPVERCAGAHPSSLHPSLLPSPLSPNAAECPAQGPAVPGPLEPRGVLRSGLLGREQVRRGGAEAAPRRERDQGRQGDAPPGGERVLDQVPAARPGVKECWGK